MITPAISVLSAVQGVEVAAPGLNDLVVPITLVILAGLFAISSRGPTASAGCSARSWSSVALARNAASPVGYFGLPVDRTVTMGSAIEL